MNIVTSSLFIVALTILFCTVSEPTQAAPPAYDINCSAPNHLRNIWDQGDTSLTPPTFEQCDDHRVPEICRSCALQLTGPEKPNGYVQQSKAEECDMGWKPELAKWQAKCHSGQIDDDLVLNKIFPKDRICLKMVDGKPVKLLKPATSSSCQDIDTTRTETGERKNYACGVRRMCGNGIMEPELGEECDPFDPNLTVACTHHCLILKNEDPLKDHKASLPYFNQDDVLFWPTGFRETVKFKEGSGPLTNPGNGHPDIRFLNQGKVIEAKMSDPTSRKAYSGVFLSNVKFNFKKNPDQVIDVHFLLQNADPTDDHPWDTDYFGLVFGITPQDYHNNDTNFFLLPWRENNLEPSERMEGYTHESRCNDSKFPPYVGQKPMGPSTLEATGGGLHLYKVITIPYYKELWTLHNCSVHNGLIRIPLEEPQPWNKLGRNPLYHANPYYINQFIGYSRDAGHWSDGSKRHHSVQMRARFTRNTLEVWVNGQKTIDIEKPPEPESIKGYVASDYDLTQKVTWPIQGQWGFYILGLDNFRVDFRGVAPQFRNERNPGDPNCAGDYCAHGTEQITQVPDDILEWRCDRCGDGILHFDNLSYTQELCDFSDNANYRRTHPGCTTECQPQEGWFCEQYKNYCYKKSTTIQYTRTGDKITGLGGTVRVNGGPGVVTENIWSGITIVDENGEPMKDQNGKEIEACKQRRVILPNWQIDVFDPDCPLEPGKTYIIKISKYIGLVASNIEAKITVPKCGDVEVQGHRIIHHSNSGPRNHEVTLGEVQYDEACDFGITSNGKENQGCTTTCESAKDWICDPGLNLCLKVEVSHMIFEDRPSTISGTLTLTGPKPETFEGQITILDNNGNPVQGCDKQQVDVTQFPRWSYNIEKNCALKPNTTYPIGLETKGGQSIVMKTFEIKADEGLGEDHASPNKNDANSTGLIVGGCAHAPGLPSDSILLLTTLGFIWMGRRKTK